MNQNKRIYIVAVICLFLMLGLSIVFFSKATMQPSREGHVDSQPSGIVWDSNAEEGGLAHRSEEEIRAELNEKVAQGMINISMNTSPVFENGSAEGNLLIVNSERNNYPQIVTIVRKDTGEEIYRSGGIPVGSKIERARLDADLPAGTYECVAYFNNVDPETGDFLGTAGAEIVLTVQH